LEHSELTERLDRAKQRRADAGRLLDPYRPALEAAHQDVEAARQHVWTTNARLTQARALQRRRARHDLADAKADLDAALERQQQAELAAQPANEAISAAHAEVRGLRDRLDTVDLRRRMALGYVEVDQLRHLRHALHQWRRWADGHPMPGETAGHVVDALGKADFVDRDRIHDLVAPLSSWAVERGISTELRAPALNRSIGIELDL
jgi:predicted  nucleic acid-binding Zn-ribbon protein